ncbi:hypothetical protein CHCC20375_1112 [Bacillus licheniformis]|nr:hypothetical protein CHCC20375_1112 [Bacillus licheniformis]
MRKAAERLSRSRHQAGFFYAAYFMPFLEKYLVFERLNKIHYKRMKKMKHHADMCRHM